MATELNFDYAINSSLQVGDTLYFTPPPTHGVTAKPKEAGVVTNVLHTSGILSYEPSAISPTQPTQGDYILFSKPIQIDESSLKGYYADVTFVNRSTKKAELFAVSSEIALSSK